MFIFSYITVLPFFWIIQIAEVNFSKRACFQVSYCNRVQVITQKPVSIFCENKTEPGWVVSNRGNELENVHMHMKMHNFPFYCAALVVIISIL